MCVSPRVKSTGMKKKAKDASDIRIYPFWANFKSGNDLSDPHLQAELVERPVPLAPPAGLVFLAWQEQQQLAEVRAPPEWEVSGRRVIRCVAVVSNGGDSCMCSPPSTQTACGGSVPCATATLLGCTSRSAMRRAAQLRTTAGKTSHERHQHGDERV
jgi:hypothetical protein